jgi:Uma2 family endonuclease
MRGYAEHQGLGRVLGPDSLVHLAICRLFAPDLFFIKQRRVTVPMPREFEGSPDHVTEILSPSNREDDLENKRPAYQAATVGEIWIVDPANQEILVDHRRGNRYMHKQVSEGRLTSTVIKGFWIKAEWLWADPLPNALPCLLEILKEGR